MKPYTRAERISVKIQSVLTELLTKKIQDPRIEMVTISGVKLSPDLRIAQVYFAVYGDDKRIKDALEGFKRSKGFIKKRIAPELGLKFMPDLRFVHDDTFDKAARMDALIKSASTGPSDEQAS
ncbi:30S ribosome-binding factor RbfA [Desulfobacula sp.]|uniref:30S ribosome-binding factor RbfA n=1 Tax=Desulfobacula sp. TaxID=2593537 RepID=UPI002636F007|nr:30S ribosome-binding factor RbfA [Desulfobacula sp.]